MRGERRGRRRWPTAPTAAAVVGGLLVAVLVGVGVVARLDAADTRSHNDRVLEALRPLERTERETSVELRRLVRRAGAARLSFDAFLAAARAQVGSSNQVVTVAKRAADLFIAGQKSEVVGVLQSEMTPVVGDLETTTKAVRDASTVMAQRIAELMQAFGG